MHLTTVHPARDPRILVREVGSLASAHPEVVLVANGDESFEAGDAAVIGLYDGVPASVERLANSSRLVRPVISQLLALRLLARLRPAVVHGHDPELLPLLVLLRFVGIRTVFDCHEDLRKQISKKPHLGRLGPLVGRSIEAGLYAASRVLSAVVVAHVWQYPDIPGRVVLRNFPSVAGLPEPVDAGGRPGVDGPLKLVYVGRVEPNRGAATMLDFLGSLRADGVDATLTLVGQISDALVADLAGHPAWDGVDVRGPLPWSEAMAVVADCHVGLFLARRTPAYELSESTKLYEYLALGLPAVFTDMQVNRDLLAERPDLALHLVSAEEPVWPTLAELTELRATARAGAAAAREGFSWATEEPKLFELYERLLAA